jgi:hypothetical protein
MSNRARGLNSKPAYSAPTLMVYGGMAKLTASGTVAEQESGSMATTGKL